MGVFSSIFGKKNKSTSTSNQTTTPQPLPSFAGPLNDIGTRAGQLLQDDPAALVAPLNDTQQRAISGVENLAGDDAFSNRIDHAINTANGDSATDSRQRLGAGPAQGIMDGIAGPGVDLLQGWTVGTNYKPGDISSEDVNAPALNTNYSIDRIGTTDTTAQDIQQRMSPYTQSVIDPALQEFDLNADLQSAQSRARRAGQRAFGGGGERAALMEQYLQGLARSKVQSGLLQSGFESAQGLTATDKARALQAGVANQGASTNEQQLGAQTGIAGAQMGLQSQLANQQAALTAAQSNQQAGLTANAQKTSAQAQNLQALVAMAAQRQQGATSIGQLQQSGLAQAGAQGNQAALIEGQLAGQDVSTGLGIAQGLMGAGNTQYDVTQRGLQAPYTQLGNISNIVYGSPMGQTSTGTTTGTTTSTPSPFDVVSGIVKAGASMGSFARGGHVRGYADGGHVSPSAYFRRYNNQHRGYADGGSVDDDEDPWNIPAIPGYQPTSRSSMSMLPKEVRDLSWRNNSAALLDDEMQHQPMAEDMHAGLPLMGSAQRFENTRADPRALQETDSHDLEIGGYDPFFGNSRRPSSPALQASSSADLMQNTLSALAQKPRRGFMQRVNDFLNADSTVEGFGMFSPAWAALAERRDASRKETQKTRAQFALEDYKFGQQASLKRDEMKNALDVAHIAHPDKGFGAYSGEGLGAQDSNIVLQYKQLAESGQPVPPDLEAAYQVAYSRLIQPHSFTDAQGNNTMIPGADLRGFPTPRGGGAALGNGSDPYGVTTNKPITKEETGTITAVRSARKDLDSAKAMLFDKAGKLNRGVVGTGFLPASQGRQVEHQIFRALDPLIRLRTGAGLNKDELPYYRDTYVPSPYDSDADAKEKFGRLEDLYRDADEMMSRSRPNASEPALTKRSRHVYDRAKGDFVDQQY